MTLLIKNWTSPFSHPFTYLCILWLICIIFLSPFYYFSFPFFKSFHLSLHSLGYLYNFSFSFFIIFSPFIPSFHSSLHSLTYIYVFFSVVYHTSQLYAIYFDAVISDGAYTTLIFLSPFRVESPSSSKYTRHTQPSHSTASRVTCQHDVTAVASPVDATRRTATC